MRPATRYWYAQVCQYDISSVCHINMFKTLPLIWRLMPSYVQELRIEEQVMFNLWWRNDGHQFLLSMWNSQVSPSGLKFIEDKNTHRLMLMTFASHDVSWSLKPTNLRSRGGQRTESLLQHHGNLSKTSSKTSWDHLYSRNACAKLASPNQQHSTALITGKQRFCSVFFSAVAEIGES